MCRKRDVMTPYDVELFSRLSFGLTYFYNFKFTTPKAR